MKNQKIKVLHYIKHLECGGGEMLLYNLYQHMNRDKVQFDFLVNTNKEEALNGKLKALGCKVIPLMNNEPKFIPWKILKASFNLKKILANGEYKIIHIHCSNSQGLIYAHIARKAKVPVIVIHAHNSFVDGSSLQIKQLFHRLFKNMYLNDPTDYFACSELAARWLFSENIANNNCLILKNGIDIEKYKYSSTVRASIRRKYGIGEDKKVILNVGRFETQKNQKFLIDVFENINTQSNDYMLIIIGRGSLKYEIEEKVSKSGLNDKIIFIDHTFEVEKFMFASDFFVFPSLHEGLGIAAIEAQASGLPTVISDGVPKDVAISNLVLSIPLDASADIWAKKIMELSLNNNRESCCHAIKKYGYDICESAKILEEFYTNKVRNK